MFGAVKFMFKVRIDYCGYYGDLVIETELPKIPTRDEKIGFWNGKNWVIAKVDLVVFELDEQNKYLLAEINVSD